MGIVTLVSVGILITLQEQLSEDSFMGKKVFMKKKILFFKVLIVHNNHLMFNYLLTNTTKTGFLEIYSLTVFSKLPKKLRCSLH